MECIKNSYVKKVYEFPKIIKINIPDYDQYNDDMKSLTEFEVFDRFIEKVLSFDSKKTSIIEQIQVWAKQSIRKLKMRYVLLKKTQQFFSQFNNLLIDSMEEQERIEHEAEKRHEKEMEEQRRKQHEAEEILRNEIEKMKKFIS